MQCSEQGIALIRRFEGFCATPYRCPAGKWTIGYGHVIRANESFPHAITQEDAKQLLQKDIAATEQAVCRRLKFRLAQHQFDEVVSFVYNVGITAFSTSTMLKKLNSGDVAGAGQEFARWDYVSGAKVAGLTRRREEEYHIFRNNK